MAEPAVGGELSAGVFRRVAGQNTRRGFGAQQGGLHCARRSGRRNEGHPGLWIENSEGAKFWLRVMNELKNRGVSDVLTAVVDGLKGFPEAINAVFPQTIVQTSHRASYSPFDGFRLLERPQSPRRRIEGDLSSQRRRRRQVSAGGFRHQPLGRKISGDRAKMETQLGASFRSSPFRRPSGGSSTPPTPSRRSTQNYAAPCA